MCDEYSDEATAATGTNTGREPLVAVPQWFQQKYILPRRNRPGGSSKDRRRHPGLGRDRVALRLRLIVVFASQDTTSAPIDSAAST